MRIKLFFLAVVLFALISGKGYSQTAKFSVKVYLDSREFSAQEYFNASAFLKNISGVEQKLMVWTCEAMNWELEADSSVLDPTICDVNFPKERTIPIDGVLQHSLQFVVANDVQPGLHVFKLGYKVYDDKQMINVGTAKEVVWSDPIEFSVNQK